MATKCHSTQAPLGSDTTGRNAMGQSGERPSSPTAYRDEMVSIGDTRALAATYVVSILIRLLNLYLLYG